MRIKYFLLMLLVIPLAFAFDPRNAPDAIDFYKYRLIYRIDVSSLPNGVNTTDFYVRYEVPHNLIDDMLAYYTSHGYTWNDSMWPIRVFYIKNNSTMEQEMLSYYVNTTYRGVPDVIYAHIDSLNSTLGNEQYIVVYMPLYFWDDFEEEINGVYDSVGEGGRYWKVSYLYEYTVHPVSISHYFSIGDFNLNSMTNIKSFESNLSGIIRHKKTNQLDVQI